MRESAILRIGVVQESSRLGWAGVSTFEWFSDLDEVRQDAMVSICLNLGLTRLHGFKKALRAMRYNLYEEAATEFLDSKWHSQVGFRAKELAEMIRTGEYPEE